MILVLDFGGQYAQLIARRVREARVYSELIPYDTPVEEIRAKNPEGIILSGGPNSVYQDDAPRVEQGFFDLDAPPAPDPGLPGAYGGGGTINFSLPVERSSLRFQVDGHVDVWYG